MKVIIGSINPVKIQAVKNAFSLYFDSVDVISLPSLSGVGSTPQSDNECITGAINRAKDVLGNADFSVGLEGGVDSNDHGMFLTGWAAIIDKHGSIGIGCGPKLLLPVFIAERIRAGGELGSVMEIVTGERNIKHHRGAFGYFTENRIDRTAALEQAVICAMSRFINTGIYT